MRLAPLVAVLFQDPAGEDAWLTHVDKACTASRYGIRLAAAAPILALLAVVDSVSWLVSFCVDLAMGAALVAVLSVGRSKQPKE